MRTKVIASRPVTSNGGHAGDHVIIVAYWQIDEIAANLSRTYNRL